MLNFKSLRLAAVLLAGFVLAGCATTEQEPASDAGAVAAPAPQEVVRPAEPPPAPPPPAWRTTSTGVPISQRTGQPLATTFYFDFDKAIVKREATAVLFHHARYLKENPNVTVRLEGHTDERGTREYNQALGERRAQAVRDYLLAQGVSRRQLETVSYGEERPAVMGHDESAWSKNRRVELKYR